MAEKNTGADKSAQQEATDVQVDETVAIILLKDPNDLKSKVVPVSVNGKTWAIERGKEVKVPRYVYDILCEKQETYTRDESGKPVVNLVSPYQVSLVSG